MKLLLTAIGALALVWLAGCASPPNSTRTAAATSTAALATPRAASGTGLTAQSPLQPLSAARAASLGVAALLPPADLWERIRRGFAMPSLEGDLVRDRELWYANRPDTLYRISERSRKYLFHIVEELERRNMPTELALLPFVESAFNPQAVSSAKAAGMWQFMPSTGKDFDLKQNVFRDDRRDVLASTRAALDYLQKLYNQFGDWHLALAAYNWGEGSVGRAVAKNQRAGLPQGYADLNMPMETRFYVPKLQAIKNIVAQPQSFNMQLPEIGNHPYFQMVDVRHDIDVALVARLAEVSPEDFRALNPSAHRPVILAAGTPQILLPWDNAMVFQSNLQAYGGRLASWTAWIAPSTMTAASAARQVGMAETDLRNINRIPSHMMIKAGSTLLVPRTDKLEADVAPHVADNGQMALTPEIVIRRHSVKAGRRDSVASVAQRYRVSAASVAQWNQTRVSASFRPGQRVVLMLPVSAAAAAVAPAAAATTTSSRVAAVSPKSARRAAVARERAPRTASKAAARAPLRTMRHASSSRPARKRSAR